MAVVGWHSHDPVAGIMALIMATWQFECGIFTTLTASREGIASLTARMNMRLRMYLLVVVCLLFLRCPTGRYGR